MWQQFLQDRPERAELAFLSVAVDVDPQRPVPFAKDLLFPTAIDSAGQLSRLFDFDVVHNGIFVDEQGVIRFIHIGGFDIRRPEVAPQVDALLETDFSRDAHYPESMSQEALEFEVLRMELAETPDDAALHFALAKLSYQQGRTAEALGSWRAALELDPANFTVRKQIWMIEHPEKFYPTIDFDWQKEQLKREGYAT